MERTTNQGERDIMANQYNVGTCGTKIGTVEGQIAITYWGTHVVKFDHEKIVLNSNGYRTATTKTRMNQAANQFGLNFSVFQKKGAWFVDFGGKVIPFEDHMILNR
jgi:hypothetical protein